MNSKKENIYSLKGISSVYRFTLTQTFKNKAYIASFIIFVLFMTFSGPINYLFSNAGITAAENAIGVDFVDSELKKVYVLNETSYELVLDDESINSLKLEGIEFEVIKTSSTDETFQKLTKNDAAVVVSSSPEAYRVDTVKSVDSEIDNKYMSELADIYADLLDKSRGEKSSVSKDDLKILRNGLDSSGTIKEEEYEAAKNDTVSLGTLVGYVTAFSIMILIVSSMSISFIISSVTEEKTSKLVETLLVSVRPMALMMGKVFGMMTYVVLLLIVGFTGSKISDAVLSNVFNINVSSAATSSFNFGIFTKFGIKGLILMLISVIFSFIAFGLLSALFGSACNKTEDIQSATGSVMTVIMVGYMAACFVPLFEKPMLLTVASVIPPVSFFLMPITYLSGRASLLVYLLAMGIQAAIIVVITVLCAKTYRSLVLNDSSKPKFKDILASLKH